jgi:Na+-translocating ferredoxin:NAD+ oxidoreductase RnfD subunit
VETIAARGWVLPSAKDPRIPFACIMALYCVLGTTVLAFNRSPLQIALTIGSCCALDFIFHWLFCRREKIVPLSAFITGAGISLLLNYSHNCWLLFLPVFFAIASKYVITYQGRHVINPNLCGVMAALTLGDGLFASSPSYQWGGTGAIVVFIVMAALVLFVFKVGRTPLIVSFLVFYFLQTALRAWIMRWHVPPETLFYGALTSPAFFLFTFYMITDPKTSPSSTWGQIGWAFGIVFLDLVYHLKFSLSTFFYALFFLSLGRWAWLHGTRLWREGWPALRDGLVTWGYATRVATLSFVGTAGFALYAFVIHPQFCTVCPGFKLVEVPESQTGIHSELSHVLETIDPRVQPIAKWLLSVGDAVAVADIDQSGRQSIFLTNPLKRAEDRNALYRNLGGDRFERVPLPALDDISAHPEKYGIIAGALFADYDNSGEQSLFLITGYGKVVLLKNRFKETGRLEFADVTKEAGLDEYTIGVSATFFDYDRDGKLDLLIGNTLSTHLADYPIPTQLNIFHLPEPEYPGDRRMFHFMHDSWFDAENGGGYVLYHNIGNGKFEKMDAAKMGMPQTHWTMAIGTGDFNHDGYTDLYCASDFGPDDVYLNDHGHGFKRVSGTFVGSVGRDTYKGMNVSVGDLDNCGQQDIYISNVHAPLQAEGSLLWRTRPNPNDPFTPKFEDTATNRGVINERRFGWGAAMGDLNLDGWLDIVQANGMVDDAIDKKFPTPHDYWYQASHVMRSGPEIHSYADRWADLRGYDIFGHQANRVYISRGAAANPEFIDAATEVGLTQLGNSRAIALVDFENHGVLDVLITHQFANTQIFHNTLRDDKSLPTAQRHWLGFLLHGDGSKINSDAVGSQVFIRYVKDGKPIQQMREISLTSGFSAQSDRRMLFGLDDYKGPVNVEIDWYGGPKQFFTTPVLDHYNELTFGTSEVPMARNP